jgi:hypothetical protein
VQIAESVGGRRRIVRHVGSARDEAELGLLMEEAHRLLADDRQGVLDLGISPALSKAVMVPPPAQAALFVDTADRSASQRMVSRPRVLKTCSGLLYDVLAGVYSSLGFDVVGDEVFRDLVIARVVEPTSLLDIDRVLAEMGSSRSSSSSKPGTAWPTWSSWLMRGCCPRATSRNSTKRNCGSSSAPASRKRRRIWSPTSDGTATRSPTGR